MLQEIITNFEEINELAKKLETEIKFINKNLIDVESGIENEEDSEVLL
jgi:hypothetical protein